MRLETLERLKLARPVNAAITEFLHQAPLENGPTLIEEQMKDDSLSPHCQAPTDSPESPPMKCESLVLAKENEMEQYITKRRLYI